MYRLNMALAEKTLRKRNLKSEEREEAEEWLEKKKKYNEKSRIRQRRFAEKKKKEREENKNKPHIPVTRKQADKKKEYERNKKRKQREAYSVERHEAVKARRRELYAQKRQCEKDVILQEREKKLKADEEHLRAMEAEIRERERQLQLHERDGDIEARKRQMKEFKDAEGNDVRSNPARRQSLKRALHALPSKTSHFVGTVVDILNKASPTKQAAFTGAGVKLTKTARRQPNLEEVVTKGLSSRLKEEKKSRKILASTLHLMKKYRLQRQACKRFGVNKKLINKKLSKQGRPKVNLETVKQVHEFYEVNSSEMPDKRLVSKKTRKPRRIIDTSIAILHEQYNKTYPDQQVCSSSFYALRPKHVSTKRQAKYHGCLCEYCENLQLKLEVLANVKLRTVYDVANATLCPKPSASAFHRPTCLERKCGNCGIHKLDDIFHDKEPHEEVEWKVWKMVNHTCHTKSNKTKEVKKRSLVTEKGTVADLIKQLKDEANDIAVHLFNKDWQQQQFSKLKTNLPEGAVLSIVDFSENYKCGFQREVQTAYYAQNSATLHPMVNYYRCETCREVVQESCIVISDDLRHDYHLVHAMQAKVCKHLAEKRGLNIKVMYRYSDGCASQYKSKGPFSDVSYFTEDFGFPVIHNYFGSRHGKGPSDGEGAVVKSQASTAVLTRKVVISDAKALYEFSKKHLDKQSEGGQCCKKFLRTSFFVSHAEVNRDRENRSTKLVKGSRKLHCVKTVESGVISTRNLTCVCDTCLLGHGNCRNNTYVENWKKVDLRAANKQGMRLRANTTAAPADPTSDVLTAVVPDDVTETLEPPTAVVLHGAGTPATAHRDDPPDTMNMTEPQSSDDSERYKVNTYVAVRFEVCGKKTDSTKGLVYMALITAVRGDVVQVKFLKRTTDGLYSFSPEPEAAHPKSDIVGKLPVPVMHPVGRKFLYEFDQTVLSTLSGKYGLE
ncbi:uncharacterized protein [Diadema setosum]